MRVVDLIRQKRDGHALEPEAIRAFVAGATTGSWPDYQVAALLMAIVLRGMTPAESGELLAAMIASGATLDLGASKARAVDKHSTGGVGDKTSLVLAPLAAACGVVVPMMSGRGLGHTGGTLDKLEAIPGFRTGLSLAEIRSQLDSIGCALVGQTEEIAPADRRLYALRDVTGTVESMPLIAASILSKKIAEGIGGLVLDVKVGRGTFMKTEDDARALAEMLVGLSAQHGVRAEALLTAMDAPLGLAVGNSHEVIEAVETLKGRGPADVESLSVQLASRMLVLAGVAVDGTAAEARVRQALASGSGLERFGAIIEAQGGDPGIIDDYGRLPIGVLQDVVRAEEEGVVTGIDAEQIGRAAVALGAGRERVDGVIDPGAGIEILAPVGTPVTTGDPVLLLIGSDPVRLRSARGILARAVSLDVLPPVAQPLVIDTITHARSGSSARS
jgi:pyrimidine-nucleoside phosphorylase